MGGSGGERPDEIYYIERMALDQQKHHGAPSIESTASPQIRQYTWTDLYQIAQPQFNSIDAGGRAIPSSEAVLALSHRMG